MDKSLNEMIDFYSKMNNKPIITSAIPIIEGNINSQSGVEEFINRKMLRNRYKDIILLNSSFTNGGSLPEITNHEMQAILNDVNKMITDVLPYIKETGTSTNATLYDFFKLINGDLNAKLSSSQGVLVSELPSKLADRVWKIAITTAVSTILDSINETRIMLNQFDSLTLTRDEIDLNRSSLGVKYIDPWDNNKIKIMPLDFKVINTKSDINKPNQDWNKFTSLRQIVTDLNKKSTRKIVIDPSLSEKPVFIYNTDSLPQETIIRAISVLYNLDIFIISNEIHLNRKGLTKANTVMDLFRALPDHIPGVISSMLERDIDKYQKKDFMGNKSRTYSNYIKDIGDLAISLLTNSFNIKTKNKTKKEIQVDSLSSQEKSWLTIAFSKNFLSFVTNQSFINPSYIEKFNVVRVKSRIIETGIVKNSSVDYMTIDFRLLVPQIGPEPFKTPMAIGGKIFNPKLK